MRDSAPVVDKTEPGIHFDAAVSRYDGGWTAEIRIPFQSLRFDPRDGLARSYLRPKLGESAAITWAPIDRGQNNWLAKAAGLRVLVVKSRAGNFELLPTLTTRWAEEDGQIPDCAGG